MSPIAWLRPLRKYADFSGRASRNEYWGFTLLLLMVGVIAVAIELRFELPRIVALFGPLTLPLALGAVVPGLAVQTRRLHDIGLSGWWALVMWIPYGASILYVASQPSLGFETLLDSGFMSGMMMFSALQAAGGFALFVLLTQRGVRRSNAYGDDPYQEAEAASA